MIFQSRELEVELLPQIGAKIGRMTDRSSGYSYLVPPQRTYRTIPYGAQWIDYDTSGMDDCFPNIAADQRLPQQGEWVFGEWRIASVGQGEATLERDGALLPYRARKHVRLEGRTLHLDYAVENTSDEPLRYLWAAHPLIVAGEEYSLRIPGARFVMYPPDGQTRDWPRLDGLDLSSQWIPRGQTLKIFVSGLFENWCELRLPARSLRFEFDLTATPAVGVWFNNFGFPFRCIAVEPCTSTSDELNENCPAIPPHGEVRWWLRMIAG